VVSDEIAPRSELLVGATLVGKNDVSAAVPSNCDRQREGGLVVVVAVGASPGEQVGFDGLIGRDLL
jgi:hypothetical protein